MRVRAQMMKMRSIVMVQIGVDHDGKSIHQIDHKGVD